MGEGVRELADVPEGEEVIEPSSVTRAGDCERALLTGFRPEDRVAIMLLEAAASFFTALLLGVFACFGAGGGLLSFGMKSMIRRMALSQPYCRASAKPLSGGTQVPAKEYLRS